MSVAVQLNESAPGRISVQGALTFSTARKALNAGVRLLKASDARELEMDCEAVNEADSAGLAVLLQWLAWAHANNRTLTFANLPKQIRAVARISDVDPLLAGPVTA